MECVPEGDGSHGKDVGLQSHVLGQKGVFATFVGKCSTTLYVALACHEAGLASAGKAHHRLSLLQILEWTESPDQALEWSIKLNDKWELDGRDSNGYVGCMWSIGGIHDQVPLCECHVVAAGLSCLLIVTPSVPAGLGRAGSLWQNTVHELQWLQAQVQHCQLCEENRRHRQEEQNTTVMAFAIRR